jgi:hypothetical protein
MPVLTAINSWPLLLNCREYWPVFVGQLDFGSDLSKIGWEDSKILPTGMVKKWWRMRQKNEKTNGGHWFGWKNISMAKYWVEGQENIGRKFRLLLKGGLAEQSGGEGQRHRLPPKPIVLNHFQKDLIWWDRLFKFSLQRLNVGKIFSKC